MFLRQEALLKQTNQQQSQMILVVGPPIAAEDNSETAQVRDITHIQFLLNLQSKMLQIRFQRKTLKAGRAHGQKL